MKCTYKTSWPPTSLKDMKQYPGVLFYIEDYYKNLLNCSWRCLSTYQFSIDGKLYYSGHHKSNLSHYNSLPFERRLIQGQARIKLS